MEEKTNDSLVENVDYNRLSESEKNKLKYYI